VIDLCKGKGGKGKLHFYKPRCKVEETKAGLDAAKIKSADY
jgi:hypothetical protein